MNKIIRLARDPYYVIGRYCLKNHPNIMSDRFFLKVAWKQFMGYELDLDNPQTFNEKLQWLKLHDRNPLYTLLVDKYLVKEWIGEKIGKEHLIPTLAIYRSINDICIDELPNQFVLKCNHDSGSTVICKDKALFDFDLYKKRLESSLKKNYYWVAREWPYKDIRRVIMAEPLLSGSDVKDYKIYCFEGKPFMLLVVSERFTDKNGPYFDYFDLNGNALPIRWGGPNSPQRVVLPKAIDEMFEMATILSRNLHHVRIDFFCIKEHIYFGEYTFFDSAGFDRIYPADWDFKLGNLISLPSKHFKH